MQTEKKTVIFNERMVYCMQNKTCSFIGHRNVEITTELKEKTKTTVKNLIVNHGINVFLFGSKSNFNELCLKVVSELKTIYPAIKRVYVRSSYPVIQKQYEKYLLELYDDTYIPKGIQSAGRASYVERNREMINKSDFVVFYYNENYRPPSKNTAKSGTKLAYEYAVKKCKAVINIREIIHL